jgi:hypothetical protein
MMSHPWSGGAQPPAESNKTRDAFAADRDNGFDSRRALGYIGDICKIGPRISGTEGMKRQQELLRKHFEALGGKVELQRFTARQHSRRQPTEMANLMVSWHPERRRRVIICSHYDTRPIADQERDHRKWHEPFLSANDGGSGVAFLMELAHQMKDLPTEVGVDFVLFDGEEYIFDPQGDQYFFGSEQFATAYRQNRGGRHYLGAVLLDMIAGPNPQFPIERNSRANAGALVTDLWQIAAAQGCAAFRSEDGPDVRDDHIALNRAGIPAVDIIDFSYPHWHKLSDVPENCAADGLLQVGSVLHVWLRQIR